MVLLEKESRPSTLVSSTLIALTSMEKLNFPDISRFGKMPHPFYRAGMAYTNLKSQQDELKH